MSGSIHAARPLDVRRAADYLLHEATVVAKDDAVPTEDFVVLTDHHVAVIDGMTTGFGDTAIHEPRAGHIAAQRVAQATTRLHATATAADAVEMWTAELAPLRAQYSDGLFGAGIVCLSVHRREIWRIGDCHLRIGDTEWFGTKLVDEANRGFRAAINHALLAAGSTIEDIRTKDPGRLAATELLKVQPALANTLGPFGYGVLDGSPVPADYVEVHSIPSGAIEITMMSDGYPEFGRNLDDAEQALSAAGLRDPACIAELAAMLKAWAPGANGPDDRAYVRLSLKGVKP